ncbi:MAG TPA: hypothetical protein VIS95_03735 [Solirubrobacterales bacterium]
MGSKQGSGELSAGALLDALLDTSWMVRRKDAVAFGSESLLRRTHSFDFEVPPGLVSAGPGGAGSSARVPLGFWWKAPGKYTNIDFVDDSGDSLALSTSSVDEEVTVAVMHEYASRVLGLALSKIHFETLQGIANIVEHEAIEARNEVKNSWLSLRSGPLPSATEVCEREMALLARDPGFAALLEVCAMASIFTVVLHDRLGERRVIKLRYDETCTGLRGTDTYEQSRSLWGRAREMGRTVTLLLGLASYRVDIGNAFVRARRYHFEEDPPTGMRFTRITSKRAIDGRVVKAKHIDPRFHLYEKDLTSDTYLTVRGKLVVTDDWLTAGLVCTVVAIAVLVGIVNNLESLDPTSSQSVITLAVLVPSIAMSIVWRRVHWLVARQQRWLRLAFGSLGVALFYVALRIAESPTETVPVPGSEPVSRLVDAGQITSIAAYAIVWGAIVCFLLLIARFRAALANRRALRPRLG